MTREELELLLTTNSLRPTPDEVSILFAMLVVAIIFTIVGITVGYAIGFKLGMDTGIRKVL